MHSAERPELRPQWDVVHVQERSLYVRHRIRGRDGRHWPYGSYWSNSNSRAGLMGKLRNQRGQPDDYQWLIRPDLRHHRNRSNGIACPVCRQFGDLSFRPAGKGREYRRLRYIDGDSQGQWRFICAHLPDRIVRYCVLRHDTFCCGECGRSCGCDICSHWNQPSGYRSTCLRNITSRRLGACRGNWRSGAKSGVHNIEGDG